MMARKPTSAERSHPIAKPETFDPERPTPARSAVAPSSPSFDRWLDKQLAALYRDILVEPLPNDLVEIVDRIERGRSRTGK